MRQGWEVKRLGDVCEKASSSVSQNQLANEKGDYPIYGASGFIKKVSFYHRDKDYISIVKDGAGIGRIALLKAYSSVIGTLQYLIPKEEIDIHYLYYFLSSIDFYKYKVGSTIPHIYYKDYADEPITVPPLFVQKSIVDTLNVAFAAFDKAKANTEQNIRNAREQFERYLQSVFENKGENWEEKSLGDIADIEYGYTDNSSTTGNFRYIRITDIDKNGELILEEKKYIQYSKEAENFLLKDKDLLMARTGATFAKVLLYSNYEPSVFASYLIRINFTKKIENELYWYFTKSKYYWEQANNLSSGAAQPHFNGAAVKQVMFPYPDSFEDQKLLIKRFEMFLTETKKLEAIYLKKIDCLEELRKSILQKAFAGELTANMQLEQENGTSIMPKAANQ